MVKQILWIFVGTIIMIVVYKLDINFFIKYSRVFYIMGVLILLAVLLFGRVINGARSWFKVGPVSFQPSELFKVFYLIFVSDLVMKTDGDDDFLLLKILFITFVPCLLIFLEPDTGVVLLYLLLMVGIVSESGINKKIVIGIMLIFLMGLICFFGLYFLDGDTFIKIFGTSFFYRMDRLLSFTNNTSYQLNQALIGIGASGAFGFGLDHEKIYIPEVTTDFVFDLSILNFGYIIGLIIVLIYTFILFQLYKNIKMCKLKRDKCVLAGIFFMMAFQVGEHVMMNLGLTPITGITLPFMSYGGSSLISYFMLFGLVLKITTNNSSYN